MGKWARIGVGTSSKEKRLSFFPHAFIENILDDLRNKT
jgi:hypothetical protein